MSALTTNQELLASSTDDVLAPPLSSQAQAIIVFRALGMQADQLRTVYGSEAVQEALHLARLSLQASMAPEDPDATYDALRDSARGSSPTIIFYDETDADRTVSHLSDAEELIADRSLYAEEQPALPQAHSEIIGLALLFQVQNPASKDFHKEAQDLLDAGNMSNHQAAA